MSWSPGVALAGSSGLALGLPTVADDLEVQFDQSAEAGPLGLGIRRAGSAALLVQEAGGVITDGEGGQGWLDSGNLVVGTPGVARELLESLES